MYLILDAWDPDVTRAYRKLTDLVVHYIETGWRVSGGIAVAYQPPERGAIGHWVVAQAMIPKAVTDGKD